MGEQDSCFITTQKNFMNMSAFEDEVYLDGNVYSGPDNLKPDPDNPAFQSLQSIWVARLLLLATIIKSRTSSFEQPNNLPIFANYVHLSSMLSYKQLQQRHGPVGRSGLGYRP